MPRVFPHDLEAERSLLGSMLISKEACQDILNKCEDRDFYEESHKVLFNAMSELSRQNIPVDVGSDFYAYIINTAAWKSLSNDGNHNACFDDNLGKNNKVWHFIKKPNGSYKILSILDNNALDVDLGKSESETSHSP